MKTLPISHVKRNLAAVLTAGETVAVTRRGQELAVVGVRVIAKPTTTLEQRQAAGRRLIEMARAKPTVRNASKGITAELRRARDRGEIV